MSVSGQKPGGTGDGDRPTVLMVGGDPMDEAIRTALDRHRMFVERCGAPEIADVAHAAAPDLVLVIGDAARDGGKDVLAALAKSSTTSVIPVVLLAEDASLDQRLRAFRHGAVSVLQRDASADAIGRRVAELAKELPERTGQSAGELGEASLDELVALFARELKSGILSIERRGEGSSEGPMRLVLGPGRPVAEAFAEFVERLRPLVAKAEPLRFEFHEEAGGRLQLVESASETENRSEDLVLSGLRVLVMDGDPGRADQVAQALRQRKAQVAVTDVSQRGVERARSLDPEVIVVGASDIDGPGFEIVRDLRRDPRLRWASLLVVSWEELTSPTAGPDLAQLTSRIAPLVDQDLALRKRGKGEAQFDTRLEITGPGRLLRALSKSDATLHVTTRSPRALVEIDLAQGLVVGATATIHADAESEVEGTAALAALLALGTGRVRVEQRANPRVANVMSPVDEALARAAEEPMVLRPSAPPPLPTPVPGPPGGSSPFNQVPTVVGQPPPAGPAAAPPPPPEEKPYRPPAPTPAPRRMPVGTLMGLGLGPKPPVAPKGKPAPAPPIALGETPAVGVTRPAPPAIDPANVAVTRPAPPGAPKPPGAVPPGALPPAIKPAIGRLPQPPPPARVTELDDPELETTAPEYVRPPAELPPSAVVGARPSEPVPLSDSDILLSDPNLTPLATRERVAALAGREDPTQEVRDDEVRQDAPTVRPPAVLEANLSEELEGRESAVPPMPAPLPPSPRAPSRDEVTEQTQAPPPFGGEEDPVVVPRSSSRGCLIVAAVVLVVAGGAAAAALALSPALRTAIGIGGGDGEGGGAGAGASAADGAVVADGGAGAAAAPDSGTGTGTDSGTGTDTDSGTGTRGRDSGASAAPPAVAVDPSRSLDSLVTEGEALIREGRAAEALPLFDRAYELDPEDNHVLVGLAQACIASGDAARAIELAERAVQLRGRRAAYRIVLGDAHRAAGHVDQARAAYYQALRLEPQNREARAGLTALASEPE